MISFSEYDLVCALHTFINEEEDHEHFEIPEGTLGTVLGKSTSRWDHITNGQMYSVLWFNEDYMTCDVLGRLIEHV